MGKLATAYTSFFNKKLNSDGSKYAVYNYCTDFGKFWPDAPAGNGSGLPLLEVVSQAIASEKKALIIIWDDQPLNDGPAKLSPYLTPLDWALAFSTRVLKNGTEGVEFSTHIIDLTSTRFEDSFAMQMAASICEAMPWVKLYAPLPRGRRAYETQFPIQELQAGTWPGTKIKLPSTPGGKSKERLNKLNQAWRAWVVQSNDHHDLNNLIGPQVIAEILTPKNNHQGANNDSGKINLVGTMLTRLEWIGLLDRNGVKLERNESSNPLFAQHTNVVVIDDQLARGWDRVLCSLLGVVFEPPKTTTAVLPRIGSNDQGVTLFGTASPKCFLPLLGIEEGENENQVDVGIYQTRKFDDDSPFVLVLDLYLFSGKSVADEPGWYKTLASAAQKIASIEKGLAWPGFTEIDQLRGLAENGTVDETNLDTALSLLPRLCALRWPSVPIIVFSATGRRGLISKLADYGNILLSSPKPNVLAGNACEQVATFVENWQRELQAAQGLLKVQKQLIDLKEHNSEKFATLISATSDKQQQFTHVVIAFDETGNFTNYDRSAVGGVMLLTRGTSEDAAIKKSYEIQEDFRKEGINFFSRPPYYPDYPQSLGATGQPGANISTPAKRKKTAVSKELECVLEKYDKCANLSAFCLWIDKGKYSGGNEYQDGSYLRGLATCIELIACELLPVVGAEKNTTLSWWFPTKQAAHKNENNAILSAKRFDVRHQGSGSNKTETIGGTGNAYSVLVQALNCRQRSESILATTKSLRTRTIPYDDPGNGRPVENKYWQCANCDSPPVLFFKKLPLGDPTPYCPYCKKYDMFADYSVLSHLADAVLTSKLKGGNPQFPNDEVGANSLTKEWCFEVEEGEKLNDFVHVSRLLDENRLGDAFKLAFRHSFFHKGIMKDPSFATAKLEKRVQERLRAHALNISGNDLIELAGLPL